MGANALAAENLVLQEDLVHKLTRQLHDTKHQVQQSQVKAAGLEVAVETSKAGIKKTIRKQLEQNLSGTQKHVQLSQAGTARLGVQVEILKAENLAL